MSFTPNTKGNLIQLDLVVISWPIPKFLTLVGLFFDRGQLVGICQVSRKLRSNITILGILAISKKTINCGNDTRPQGLRISNLPAENESQTNLRRQMTEKYWLRLGETIWFQTNQALQEMVIMIKQKILGVVELE